MLNKPCKVLLHCSHKANMISISSEAGHADLENQLNFKAERRDKGTNERRMFLRSDKLKNAAVEMMNSWESPDK